MHSFGYRANTLLTFSVTVLALMCTLSSLSDNLNVPSPSAQLQVLNINWFQKQPNGDDVVSLTLNVTANLESLFTWNTKQEVSCVLTVVAAYYEVSLDLGGEGWLCKLEVFVFVAAEYETPQNSLNRVKSKDPDMYILRRKR